MTRFVSLLVALVAASVLAAEPFPAPNALFEKVKANPSNWKEKLVAFEGMVIQIETGPQNKSYFKIKMPQPVFEELWVASLLNLDSTTIEKNSVVRVLGYYTSVQSDDPMASVNKDGYHLLGFCMLNISTKKAHYFPGAIKQCQSWQEGVTQN